MSSRMEILWAYSYDAMEGFTESYLSNARLDVTNLPYFDLLAALRPAGKLSDWGLPPLQEQAMRNGHKLFVNQAMRELGL